MAGDDCSRSAGRTSRPGDHFSASQSSGCRTRRHPLRSAGEGDAARVLHPDKGPFGAQLPNGACSGRIATDVFIDFYEAKKRLKPQERAWQPAPIQKTLALAEEFRRQLNGGGLNQSGLAQRYGLTRARVTQVLNLLRLQPHHPELPPWDATGPSREAAHGEAGTPPFAARPGRSGEGGEDTPARLRAAEAPQLAHVPDVKVLAALIAGR